MPRLKLAGNTKKYKRCKKGFPCGYSCQPKERTCRNPLKRQAKTYQEYLKTQTEKLERLTPKIEARRQREALRKANDIIDPQPIPEAQNERRLPDDNGGISSSSDRRLTATANQDKVVTARPDLTAKADPELVPQGIRQFLSDAQVQGVAKAISAMNKDPGGFLLADGTGLGKTREILGVAEYYRAQGKKVLIVSPNEVLKPDYKKGTVTGSFDKDARAMGIETQLNKGTTPIQAGEIHLTTYHNLKNAASLIDGDTVLLLDEAHNFKNTGSAKTKYGMAMMDAADKVLYATATPVDKPEHLRYLERADVFAGRSEREIYEWMGLREKEINIGRGKTKKVWAIPPGQSAKVYERMTGLFDEMTEQGRMMKREISMKGVDVGFDTITLPQKAHDMLDDIAQAYDYGEGNGLQKAQMLMHQRRQLEPYKIDSAVEHAKKAIANGEQVVIFASRVNESEVAIKGADMDEDGNVSEAKRVVTASEGTLKTLKAKFDAEGIEVAELHGGTKTKPKDAMEAFQSGKAKVIIATIESGGTGINLDDTIGNAPRTLIMMTPPFDAVGNMQAAGRVWRMTTQSYPKIRYLFTDTQTDDWNRRIIGSKMKALGATVQGETEVLSLADDTDFNNRPVNTGRNPRPSDLPPTPPKPPKGFYSNKYGGYTPDGRYVKEGEGFIRQENGQWITYSKDQVDSKGNVTLRSKEEQQKATQDKHTQITQTYRKQNPTGHPDPVGFITQKLIEIDDNDQNIDRGAAGGWTPKTVSFGRSLARQAKSGKALSPKQLAAASKMLKRDIGIEGLPSDNDLNLMLKIMSETNFSERKNRFNCSLKPFKLFAKTA